MGSYFDIREPFSIEVTHDHRKDGRGLGFKAGRAGISRALWFPAFERVALMSWKRDALKHRGLRSVKLFRVDPIQRNGNVTKTPREEKRKCFMDKNQLSKAGGDTRRDFIKKAATAAAAVATTNVFKTPVYGQTQAPSTGRVIGANDRLVVGFVGLGNQGLNSHLKPMLQNAQANNIVVGGVCDVSKHRIEEASKAMGGSVKTYEDYKKRSCRRISSDCLRNCGSLARPGLH